MKQIILIIILSLIIIPGSLYANYYLTSSAQDVLLHVKNIQIFSKQGDWNNTAKELKSSKEKWDSQKDIWPTLIDHQIVENIESSMIKVDKYVELKNQNDTLAESASLESMIKNVPQSYKLNIENIF